MKAKRFILPLLLLCAPTALRAGTVTSDHLRVVPSALKLQAEGVRFAGAQVEHKDIYVLQKKLIYNGVAYYFSDGNRKGLVAEDLKTGALTIYEPAELARIAGWLKKDTGAEKESDDQKPDNRILGYQRVGDVIWMGTERFGVLAFDAKRKVWSRYDSDSQTDRRMHGIFYADEDYVFSSDFNIYSRKHERWLKMEAVPTRYVRRFGYSGPRVQVMWDLTKYAKEDYLPLSPYPNSLVLWWPEKVTLRDDNEAYIFEFGHEQALTEFTIEKWQIEWAFSQMEIERPAPQQAGK